MASKAIYSEIVELVLNIDKYNDMIAEANTKIVDLKRVVEAPSNLMVGTAAFVAEIDKAIAKERELAAEIRQSNKAMQERRNAAIGLLSPGESADLRNKLRMSGKADYIAASGVNVPKSQAAADEINRQLQAQDALDEANKRYSDAKTDRERKAARATVDRLNREREMEASNAQSKENNDKLIADAKRSRRRDDEAATNAMARKQREDDEARKRGQLSAVEHTRDAQARALAMEEIAHQKRMRNIMSVVEGNREIHARMLSNEAAQERMNRLAVRHASIIKGSMGYGVGSQLLQGRTGAAFTAAASGSFLLGANNLGGMFYMMERMSYATGVGQKKLGDFAEKLGLVQMKGVGAEASIARFGASVTTIAGALAAAAVPLGAMFAGNKLDNAVANMSTLLADANVKGEEFKNLMDSTANAAARVGESFGIGLVDTVNGFKTALSTGIDAAQLEQFGMIAGTVAKGLGTTFEDATGILTTFRDSYDLTVGDMAKISDVLFNAINVGKFQVDDLKNNIGRVVTSAAEAGVTFKDMSAGLATLTRVGLSTSQAITSMNRFIGNIVNPTDKAKAAFDRLGLATGHAAFKTKSLMEYLRELKAAVGGNADLMGDLFSTEQGRRGAIGLTTNLGLTGSIVDAMDATGTATVAANRAMDTFSQNFGKIFQTVWDVVQLVGRDLLQAANDVFFQGGPLGADSMVTLKTILETIGVVVKELGIILITGFGAVYHVLKNIGAIIGSISLLVRGEVKQAFTSLTDSINNSVMGIASGFVNMITTIGASADRVNSNFEGMIPEDKLVKKAAKVEGAVKSMFGEDMLKGIEQFAARTETVFAKIAKDIEKARFEAAKFEWEQANPKKAGAGFVPFKYSVADMDMLAKISIGQGIRSQHPLTWNDSIRGGRPSWKEGLIKDKIKAAGGMDPDDPETKILYDALIKRMNDFQAKAGEKAAEAYTKAYKDKMRADLGKDFPSMFPAEQKDGEKQSRIPSSQAKQLKDLMDMLDALKSGTKIKSTEQSLGYIFGSATAASGIVTESTTRDLSDGEALQKAKEMYYRIEAEYKKHKDRLTEADRTYIENYLKVAADGIKDAEAKLHKDKMEQYKKEYDFQVSMYKIKMNLINEESKAIKKLREENKELQKKVQDDLNDIRDKRRPGAGRRDAKDEAERLIQSAGSTKNPASANEQLAKAVEALNRMQAAGDAAGESGRATRDRELLLEVIDRITAENDKKLAAMEAKQPGKAADAKATLDRNVLDNPVAQAAIKQANQLLAEMTKEAAKHGISVNGELISNIDVKVNANIPIDSLRDAVLKTVRVEATRIAQDIIAGANPPPSDAGNIRPKGTTASTPSTTTTSTAGAP